MNAPARGKPPLVERGDSVTTPSGAIAKVIEVFADRLEAEVEYPDGQSACFRLGWLTPTRATG